MKTHFDIVRLALFFKLKATYEIALLKKQKSVSCAKQKHRLRIVQSGRNIWDPYYIKKSRTIMGYGTI